MTQLPSSSRNIRPAGVCSAVFTAAVRAAAADWLAGKVASTDRFMFLPSDIRHQLIPGGQWRDDSLPSMPRIRRLPRLQQSERLQKPHIAHDRLPVPLQFARQLRDGYRPCTNRLLFKNPSDLGRYAFTPIQLARALAGSREELVHGPSRQRYGRKSAASHSIHPPPSTRSPS